MMPSGVGRFSMLESGVGGANLGIDRFNGGMGGGDGHNAFRNYWEA